MKENRNDYIFDALALARRSHGYARSSTSCGDANAPIYFVPDVFVTDVIQGRVKSMNGLPVVAVCETPFTGFNITKTNLIVAIKGKSIY